MKKVINKHDLRIDWLTTNGYYIELPAGLVSRILMLGFLYRQIKEGNGIAILQQITKGISQTQLYSYKRGNWSVPGNKYNKLKLLENEILHLNIKDRKTDKLTGYTLTLVHKELMAEPESKTISVQRAVEIREELVNEEEKKRRTFSSVNEIEEVALNICQMFASGRITIYEACARFDVSYLDFFKWVIGMDPVKQMYEDSVAVAKFVTESQIYTVSANMILERLKIGYTTVTDIVYDTLWVNGQKEFTEKAKRTTTREISLSEMIRVISLLKNVTGAPSIDQDDFSDMSDDDLFNYIKEVRARVGTKRSKESDQEELPIPFPAKNILPDNE